MPSDFSVLAVCTGNICRSPAVERVLAARLGPDSGVSVRSAGTSAVVGSGMPAEMAALVSSVGVSPDAFASRQLTPDMLRDADLVLALTRAHRAAIVDLYPGAVRRTFTVRELARLAAAVGPGQLPEGTAGERLKALLPLAAGQRGLHAATVEDDDVIDPYRRSESVYAESFEQLLPAVEIIAETVRP